MGFQHIKNATCLSIRVGYICSPYPQTKKHLSSLLRNPSFQCCCSQPRRECTAWSSQAWSDSYSSWSTYNSESLLFWNKSLNFALEHCSKGLINTRELKRPRKMQHYFCVWFVQCHACLIVVYPYWKNMLFNSTFVGKILQFCSLKEWLGESSR